MAHVHRSAACLRIYGDQLDPDKISQMLGAKPTKSYRKGDIKHSKNADIIRKTGSWMFDAKDKEPENLNAQVEEILSNLTQELTIWTKLSNEYGIDLFCGFFMKESDEGFEISPQTLKALSDRGIKLAICLYASLDDGESG